MTEKTVQTGSCLCGKIHYSFAEDDVSSAAHCHCTDCQKMTGSGKATILFIPTEALTINEDFKTYTVTGSGGSHVTRGFCPDCGSQVISYVEEVPAVRFIKAGTLNDSSWVKVSSSFWESSAQPWSPVDASIPSFAGNPVS